VISGRASEAEVVAVDDLEDLGEIDFLVPVPHRQVELVDRLPGLKRLAVIQTLSAGVDALEGQVPPHITLCSARGARDSAVAEWVIGALLASTTRIAEMAHLRRWQQDHGLDDLQGSTVLIVGMGSIGRRVAGLVEGFGARPVGVVSRARDDLHGIDELPSLLPGAGSVVLLAPLTDATHHLIDAAALARMRDGALLVTAARGPIVDSEALVAETASGRLRAVLDVTDPEPLPEGHPLWDAAGVLSITSHIAGNSPLANLRAAELAGDQLARFGAGGQLHNVVQEGHRS
jgi:phosphoglycerate dehydrogenase-like enzyme